MSEKSEQFIRQQSALYRHYRIDEVVDHVQQFTGEHLTDDQAVEIVQGIRDEHEMGPIDAYNLPGGYEEEEQVERPWWKLW